MIPFNLYPAWTVLDGTCDGALTRRGPILFFPFPIRSPNNPGSNNHTFQYPASLMHRFWSTAISGLFFWHRVDSDSSPSDSSRPVCICICICIDNCCSTIPIPSSATNSNQLQVKFAFRSDPIIPDFSIMIPFNLYPAWTVLDGTCDGALTRRGPILFFPFPIRSPNNPGSNNHTFQYPASLMHRFWSSAISGLFFWHRVDSDSRPSICICICICIDNCCSTIPIPSSATNSLYFPLTFGCCWFSTAPIIGLITPPTISITPAISIVVTGHFWCSIVDIDRWASIFVRICICRDVFYSSSANNSFWRSRGHGIFRRRWRFFSWSIIFARATTPPLWFVP